MSNSVLKNKDGQILDFKIPGYEIMKYNLEADSNPVRTGRKVNGKDEYVKRLIIPSFPNAQKKKIFNWNYKCYISYTLCLYE